jgi:hypothetical protein
MTKINVLSKHAQLSPTTLVVVVHIPLKTNICGFFFSFNIFKTLDLHSALIVTMYLHYCR